MIIVLKKNEDFWTNYFNGFMIKTMVECNFLLENSKVIMIYVS